ncbi:MAG: hypothetical protein ACK5JH_10040 [Anaerocolumna sp.]
MIKSTLITELENAHNIVTKLEDVANNIEKIEQGYVIVEEKAKEIETGLSDVACAIIVIGLVIFVFSIYYGAPFVPMLLLFITCIGIAYIIELCSKKGKIETALNYRQEAIEKLNETKEYYISLGKELYCTNKFEKANSLISPEYFDSESITYFINVVKNNRADSLKEAMNLYENYLHKSRIEDINKEQLESINEMKRIQEQQLEYAERSFDAIERQNQYSEQIAYSTRKTRGAVRMNTLITLLKK